MKRPLRHLIDRSKRAQARRQENVEAAKAINDLLGDADTAAKVKRQREAELGALTKYASEVFGSTALGAAFMTAHHPELNDRTPRAIVLNEEGGFHKVEAILTRMKKGER